MSLYPLFADLAGREVLVVGGGEVAARKVAPLLKAGARVRLYARQVLHPDLEQALEQGRMERLHGEFDLAWLDRVWLAVAATDDAAFNAGLAAEAGQRQRLVNVVDDAVLSTFQVPAVVDRSPLVVAISSAGAAPMLARRVRERLETLLDPSLGTLAGLFGRHRERIRALLPDLDQRRRWFERMLDGRMDGMGSDAAGLERAFQAQLDLLAAGAPTATGWIGLLQSRPEPDLYTLRALRALNEADAIISTPDLDPAVLEPARRDAHRICPAAGDLVSRAIALASAGQRVVHIYSGQAGAELAAAVADAAREAAIDLRRVDPGDLGNGG
jgi:precorrin-2 dehydrogenase/sirohydrochlorin ferrochelatase